MEQVLSIHVRCNRWLYYNLPSPWRECEIYNDWETALDCHTYRWVCYHVTRILAFLICDLLNHPIEVEIGDLEEIILLVMASAFWPMQLVRWHFDHFYIFRTWARIVKGKPVIRFPRQPQDGLPCSHISLNRALSCWPDAESTNIACCFMEGRYHCERHSTIQQGWKSGNMGYRAWGRGR